MSIYIQICVCENSGLGQGQVYLLVVCSGMMYQQVAANNPATVCFFWAAAKELEVRFPERGYLRSRIMWFHCADA